MLICIIITFLILFNTQDHHDDIRQEQKWEMQALSTQNHHSGGSCSSNSSSASTDDAHEHNLGCDSLTCETGSSIGEQHTTTAMSPSSSSSCGNHSVENCNVSRQQQQQSFNNNTTIAISNNNNCDTIKNNNNQTHVATPIEIVNEVESAATSAVLIDQQNALLRGVNIGKCRVDAI